MCVTMWVKLGTLKAKPHECMVSSLHNVCIPKCVLHNNVQTTRHTHQISFFIGFFGMEGGYIYAYKILSLLFNASGTRPMSKPPNSTTQNPATLNPHNPTLSRHLWTSSPQCLQNLQMPKQLVGDDPKLLDDSGEVPKSEWRDSQFNFRLWNFLSTWRKNQDPPLPNRKVSNKTHPAPRGSLSMVGPTSSNSRHIAWRYILLC